MVCMSSPALYCETIFPFVGIYVVYEWTLLQHDRLLVVAFDK